MPSPREPGMTKFAEYQANRSREPSPAAILTFPPPPLSIKNKETPVTDSKDMTIKDVRVTVLRMPWANPEWIKGHALGPDRGILIVDIETAGGVTGMGYLFHFRPGLKSIA